MIRDAHSVPDGRRIEAEICIVGTGPAGLTLARELIQSDVSLCLLESGGLEFDPEIQTLAEGEVTGVSYDSLPSVRELPFGPLALTRARRFGGTSAMWNLDVGPGGPAVRLRRLGPADLESRDRVPHSGWPFDMNELLPFYEQAEAIFGLAPLADAPNAQLEEGRHMFSEDGFFESRLFHFGPRDIFAEISRSEVERATNVSVYVHGTVTRLETDLTGERVTSARVATLKGNTFSVEARTFVLAAGGVENARLLLVSDRVHERGIGNEHDLVGRFFMEHPHIRTGVIVPARAGAIDALPTEGIRRVGDQLIETRLALRRSVLQEEGLLDAVLTLIPTRVPPDGDLGPSRSRRPASPAVRSVNALRSAVRRRRTPENLLGHLGNIVSGPGEILQAGVAKLRRRMDRGVTGLFEHGRPTLRPGSIVLEVDAMSEQAPNPESRIALSDELDRLHVRRVQLDWRLNPLDLRTLVRTHQLLQEEIEREGLGRTFAWLDAERLPPRITGGHHHMGTTRMHRDPRSGVVDEHCRVHGVANLFLAGSSVFPTGGSANPTLTIVALAVRLAEHLTKEILGRPVGSNETEVSGYGAAR